MIYPIIHLNGDRAETLREQYVAAYHAVNHAHDVLRECQPNGRNYYPVPGSITPAIQEHNARLNALTKVAEELMDLAMHCDKYAKEA